MAVMTLRREIVSILILLSACGDDGGGTATISTTNPSSATLTQSGTNNTGTGMSEDSSGVTEGKTTGSTLESDSTSTPPTSSTTAADGGPVFLSFSTNVGKITEGESVTFTALLTDPDGVDDIVGGSLLNENETVDFGPLIAAGQPGTYSISLSWAQIDQSDPIIFENAESTRMLRARFFDQEGHKAVKEAEIVLFCDGGSSCDGACTNLDIDDANCGTCGHTCASMDCKDGGCAPSWSMCFAAADGFSTCTEICQSISNECAEAQCGSGGTVQYYVDMIDCMSSSGALPSAEPCGNVQTWLSPAIRCCCTDSN